MLTLGLHVILETGYLSGNLEMAVSSPVGRGASRMHPSLTPVLRSQAFAITPGFLLGAGDPHSPIQHLPSPLCHDPSGKVNWTLKQSVCYTEVCAIAPLGLNSL